MYLNSHPLILIIVYISFTLRFNQYFIVTIKKLLLVQYIAKNKNYFLSLQLFKLKFTI